MTFAIDKATTDEIRTYLNREYDHLRNVRTKMEALIGSLASPNDPCVAYYVTHLTEVSQNSLSKLIGIFGELCTKNIFETTEMKFIEEQQKESARICASIAMPISCLEAASVANMRINSEYPYVVASLHSRIW